MVASTLEPCYPLYTSYSSVNTVLRNPASCRLCAVTLLKPALARPWILLIRSDHELSLEVAVPPGSRSRGH